MMPKLALRWRSHCKTGKRREWSVRSRTCNLQAIIVNNLERGTRQPLKNSIASKKKVKLGMMMIWSNLRNNFAYLN